MFVTDVFVEWMVKRRKSPKDWALLIGAVVLAAALLFGSFQLAVTLNFPMIPYFLFFACAYGIYWLWSQLNLEFEYSFTNGDITVDKIINKKKRKRVVSFDAKNVVAIGETTEKGAAGVVPADAKTVHQAGVYANGAVGWYIIYSRDGSAKNALLFSPNEKFIKAMKPFLPVKVRIDAFGRN